MVTTNRWRLAFACVLVLAAGGRASAQATADRLADPVPVEFNAVPLVGVAERFEYAVGVPVQMDWAALRELGVGEQTPVTLRLPEVPLETAIRLAVYAAISAAQERPVGLQRYAFVVRERDGAVRVSASLRPERVAGPRTPAELREQEAVRLPGEVLAITAESITLRIDVPFEGDAGPQERTLKITPDTRVVVAGETTDERVTAEGQVIRSVRAATGRPSNIKVGRRVIVAATPEGVVLQIMAPPVRTVMPDRDEPPKP